MRRNDGFGRAGVMAVVLVLVPLGLAHGAGAQSPPGAGALGAVADTAANRQLIVQDDPALLAREAGLDLTKRLTPSNPTVQAVEDELGGESPLGTSLLSLTGALGAEPFGYDPLALTSEVAVGQPPRQLSVLHLPGSSSGVASELAKAGLRRRGSSHGVTTLTLADPLELSAPLASVLSGVRTVEVSANGVATGGAGASPVALGAALGGKKAAHPLSADPAVAELWSLFGPVPFEEAGTSLILSPVSAGGSRLSRAAADQLLHKSGLDQLKAAPTFAGYAYLPGSVTRPRVVAATLYPTPAEATTAATVLGRTLRTGTSLAADEPYSDLWQVDSVSRRGDLVSAHLTLREPQILVESVVRGDFPLFWAPARS